MRPNKSLLESTKQSPVRPVNLYKNTCSVQARIVLNQQSGILPDPGILPKPLIPSCTSQTDRTPINRTTGNQTAPTARSKHSRNITASSEMHVVPPLLFAGYPASSVLPGVLPSRLRYGGAGVPTLAAPYIADTSPRDATFNKDHRWPPGVPPSTNTIDTYAVSDNLPRRPGEHAGDHRSPPIRPPSSGKQAATHSSTGLASPKTTDKGHHLLGRPTCWATITRILVQ